MMNQNIKLPPCDLEAETTILSVMIQFPKYRKQIKEFLSKDDFYREANQYIFSAICDLETVDLVSICDKLKRSELLEKSGGQDYVSEIAFYANTGAGWKFHAQLLRELRIRRDIINNSAVMAERGFALHQELEETLSIGKEFFREIGKSKKDELPDTKKLFGKVYDNLHNDKSEPGLKTGIPSLEEFYLEPGYIHCVAAESGVGKSAFLLQIADFVSKEYGKTLYFSLESTDLKLATRLLARHSKIALTRLNKRNIHDALEWKTIQDTLFELQKSRLILIDNERLQEIERLISYAESACMDGDVKLIVIDFLQLITSNKKINSRHLEISYIISQFKHLSKQLDIPILFASQLRKDIGGRPKLDDLKESGDIRTHTDNIIFLYAPNSDPTVYAVECFLGKGKEQERFKRWLEFDGNYQEFKEGIEPENTKAHKRHWQDKV